MVDELKEFTKRAKDVLSAVAFSDRIKYLDFLNTSEQDVLMAMAKKVENVHVLFEGGFIHAERRRAIVAPIYMSAQSVDFKVSLFKIEIIGTGEITHSQVLGSLMALKIDRNVIGDISVIDAKVNSDDSGAFFTACREFDAFLIENFTKVGRHDIRLMLIEEDVAHEVRIEEIEIIVSSMRLDVIVKTLMKVARSKAEAYLDAGFVRHNHAVEKKVSRTCHVGDILSIRKHGRFKIICNKKTTKSGKIVLVVSKSV